LANAESVGDKLVWIDANLVLACWTAESSNIDDIRDGLQVLLDYPVFNRLQLHHIVVGICAFQREEVNLSDRTPVRAHLRRYARRQGNLRKALQNSFAVPGVLGIIVEN